MEIKTFEEKRQAAIESFKKANYDPYTTFINLQALHLDTKEDAENLICFLKQKDAEIRAKQTEKRFIYAKKRTADR